MVANGPLVRPNGTVLLDFELADFQYQETIIVMKTLRKLLKRLAWASYRDTRLFSTFDNESERSQPVDAIASSRYNQYPSSYTSTIINYHYPSTWKKSCNFHQNDALDRPRCNQKFHTLFTYGGT